RLASSLKPGTPLRWIPCFAQDVSGRESNKAASAYRQLSLLRRVQIQHTDSLAQLLHKTAADRITA
ncbi:hypothetical protein NEILACOT_03377, partial [Neisseria lactamica ATCC 23970]